MNNGLLRQWRHRRGEANMSAPAFIDEDALARGADAEEYNVGDPAQALSTALKNLKKDPECYSSIRSAWTLRRGGDWMAEWLPRVVSSYKRNRSMGQDHEEAIDHSMRNWEMGFSMTRARAGQPNPTEQEVAAMHQALTQAVGGDQGGQTPGDWVIAHTMPQMTRSAAWFAHLAKAKKNPAYEKETALIRENKKKPGASSQHKFKPAKWTHPNGHPRCLVCGDEETIGGVCNKTPTAKDYSDFEDEMDREFPGLKHQRAALHDRYASGEITMSQVDAEERAILISAASDKVYHALIAEFEAGNLTQTDLDMTMAMARAEVSR